MTPTQIVRAALALVRAREEMLKAQAEYAEAGAIRATAEQDMIAKGNVHAAAVQTYNAAIAVFNPDP